MSRTASILPLSEAAIGKRFRLVKIDGGHRLTRRLLALGLSLGTEFEVVQRRAQVVEQRRMGRGGGVAGEVGRRRRFDPAVAKQPVALVQRRLGIDPRRPARDRGGEGEEADGDRGGASHHLRLRASLRERSTSSRLSPSVELSLGA